MKLIDADKLREQINNWSPRVVGELPDIYQLIALNAVLELIDKAPDLSPKIEGLDEAAEESGLKYAPIESGEAIDSNGQCYDTDDINWPSRCGFIRGFKAGAKWQEQHSLTWEDINAILRIDYDLSETHFIPLKEYCEEVLKRFNEQKEKGARP